jgi:hypothetical protein
VKGRRSDPTFPKLAPPHHPILKTQAVQSGTGNPRHKRLAVLEKIPPLTLWSLYIFSMIVHGKNDSGHVTSKKSTKYCRQGRISCHQSPRSPNDGGMQA